jgi:hypothetical protein
MSLTDMARRNAERRQRGFASMDPQRQREIKDAERLRAAIRRLEAIFTEWPDCARPPVPNDILAEIRGIADRIAPSIDGVNAGEAQSK